MWRKLSLVSGVLAAHVALLGWLQLAPDLDRVVAPTLRFQLTPTAPPLSPVAPMPSVSPVRPVAGKTKTPSVVPARKQTEANALTASDTPVSPPATLLPAGLGITDKAGEVLNARNPNTGEAAPVQAAPAAPVTVLPSSNADYLNNPAPAYPALSRRLGEQGRVVIQVLIDKDGKPQQGSIAHSSGYARLDQAALRAAMDWRYVPGRRDGKAQDMWFKVPIQFALE